MKGISIFLLNALLLASCGKVAWVENIREDVRVFDNTAKEEGVYLLKRNSSTGIFLTKYEPRYGIEKLKIRHLNPGILDFERHLFFRDSLLIYAHYIGIAPQSKKEEEIQFLAFNKQYFWKNEQQGLLLQQQVICDSFTNHKGVIKLLDGSAVTTREVSLDEYDEIKDYIEKIRSSELEEVNEKDLNSVVIYR